MPILYVLAAPVKLQRRVHAQYQKSTGGRDDVNVTPLNETSTLTKIGALASCAWSARTCAM